MSTAIAEVAHQIEDDVIQSRPITDLAHQVNDSATRNDQGQPSRLRNFLPPSAEFTAACTDGDILEISSLLQGMGREEWSIVPWIYIVLHKINQLQLIDSLIDQGINDYWLPFDQRSLSHVLSMTARTEFLTAQVSIMTTAVDLEKNINKKHYHFKDQDSIAFEIREILGRGAISKVDKVYSHFSHREYARKLFKRQRGPSETDIQAFMNELRILKRIRHQHCVELVGCFLPLLVNDF